LSTHLQLGLDDEESARYAEVIRRARARNAHVTHANIARQLVGLSPPDCVVTEDDVAYFRGEKGYQRESARATLATGEMLPLQDIRSLERHLRKAQEIATTLKLRTARQD
jgi:hypothetical protein